MKYTFQGGSIPGNGAALRAEAREEFSDSVEVYLREIARLEPLAPSDEQTLAREIVEQRRSLRASLFRFRPALEHAAALLVELQKNPRALDQHVRIGGSPRERERFFAALPALIESVRARLDAPAGANGATGDARAVSRNGNEASNGDARTGGRSERPVQRPGGGPALVRPPAELVDLELPMPTIRELARELEHASHPETVRAVQCEVRDAFEGLAGAVRRLCHGNLAMVVAVAKRQPPRGIPLGDLIQEGNTALLRAAERFTPRGEPFRSFAKGLVEQAMRRFAEEQSRLIRVPAPMLRALRRVRRYHRDVLDREGRDPSPEETATALGLQIEEVYRLESLDRTPVSIDEPLDDEESTSVGDLIEDPSPDSPLDRVQRRTLARRLDRMLECLTLQERDVLRLRYGLSPAGYHTLDEVAARLDVSPSRVRKIQANAFRKLAGPPFRRQLEEFLEALD